MKAISLFVLLGILPVLAHADTPAHDLVMSTAAISVVNISSSVATVVTTNSGAMKYRTTYAIQNIGANNIWCMFDNTVAVNRGWLLIPYASLSVPIKYYSGTSNSILRLYCLSETATTKLAVMEAY